MKAMPENGPAIEPKWATPYVYMCRQWIVVLSVIVVVPSSSVVAQAESIEDEGLSIQSTQSRETKTETGAAEPQKPVASQTQESQSASAEEKRTPPQKPELAGQPQEDSDKSRQFYGDVLLLSYALATILAAGLIDATESSLALGSFMLPSLVHFAYGNDTGGAVSLVAIPGVMLLSGYVFSMNSSSGDWYSEAGIGALFGYAIWAAIDSSFFAYRADSQEAKDRNKRGRIGIGAAPVAGGAIGVLGGRF